MARRTPRLFPGHQTEARKAVVLGYIEGGKTEAGLTYDALQWILNRVSIQTGKWQAELWPTSKAGLLRWLGEWRVTITPAGQAFLDGLDEFFPGSAGDNRRMRQ